MSKKLITAFIVFEVFVVSPAHEAAGQSIEVPDVDWLNVVPYLRANLMVTYKDGQSHLGTFSTPNRETFDQAYDPTLDELAKVLLAESLSDRRVMSAVDEVSAHLRASGIEQSHLTPAELGSLYWQRLMEAGDFLYQVRRLFERARAKGRMNCYICAQGFEAKVLQVYP